MLCSNSANNSTLGNKLTYIFYEGYDWRECECGKTYRVAGWASRHYANTDHKPKTKLGDTPVFPKDALVIWSIP